MGRRGTVRLTPTASPKYCDRAPSTWSRTGIRAKHFLSSRQCHTLASCSNGTTLNNRCESASRSRYLSHNRANLRLLLSRTSVAALAYEPAQFVTRSRQRVKISGDNLAPQLARGLSPIYLVSGDEPLLVNEAADAIRARARTEGFTERDFTSSSGGSIGMDCRRQPLYVVVRGAQDHRNSHDEPDAGRAGCETRSSNWRAILRPTTSCW